jgi:membrane protease YdiL (CAAX protease family)
MAPARDKRLLKYLVYAFAIAWVLQIIASVLYWKWQLEGYSSVLAISMLAPLVAAALSGMEWKKAGWKPVIRGNIRYILAAWIAPVLLGIAGAAIYFLLFPGALDTKFDRIVSILGKEGADMLEASGISIPAYIAVSSGASMLWAPWFNMFFAVGEEAGWRGAMYPILKERLGITKGRIVGGIIWGVWHWPIMLLTGYEYGTDYWGAPVSGPLLFCVITVAMGILFDYLYEKTNCIWVPALCHGSLNAFAGMPALIMNPAYPDQLLLGPLMIGIIGGFPLILSAVLISIKAPRAVPPAKTGPQGPEVQEVPEAPETREDE